MLPNKVTSGIYLLKPKLFCIYFVVFPGSYFYYIRFVQDSNNNHTSYIVSPILPDFPE